MTVKDDELTTFLERVAALDAETDRDHSGGKRFHAMHVEVFNDGPGAVTSLKLEKRLYAGEHLVEKRSSYAVACSGPPAVPT